MLEKKYDFKSVEENKYSFWLENDLFKCGDKSKKPFTIILPPPNITGNLHIGHAFDTALQDVIIRYKKLKGFDTLWLPGMDHAAIATENKVVASLKAKGINKYEYGRDNFLSSCWKWKEEHSDHIRKQWAKLGLSLDYTKERFTLDDYSKKAVYTVFKKMYDEGLIYRGEKIINWDPLALTALSNEEVIYKEEDGKLYYLKYYFENKKDYILVATTRPETIFGDTAVAVNPKDEKYKKFVGKMVYVPLTSRLIPIISDDAVLLNFGTGALKITPAHALEDFEIGQRHNLEIIKTINKNGTLNELTGKYNGLGILAAREEIVKDLAKKEFLEKEEKYTHSVGYSERTNALVEPFLSLQWFVKMDTLAARVLETQKSKDKVQFVPQRFEKILINWMNGCRDWCISRQLWWGIKIPVWYKDDEIIVSEECPGKGYIQDNDVLDTWFSSALWPFSTLGWPFENENYKRYFPTDVLVTGYDIIFFWVARMIFQSLYSTDNLPFKECVIHGIIRDNEGRKMSKSLGNGIDPMEMIEKYGCDSIRYFLTTSGAPGMDLRFDEDKVSSTWNFINKLWNASRFVLQNIEALDEFDIDYEKLEEEDKWIISELNKTIKNVTQSMDKYRFNDSGAYIYEFVWSKFCDWYIEFSKRKLDNKNTLKILYKVLKDILIMLNPFMPFVTEEVYQMLPNHKLSIMIEDYPYYNKKEVYDTKEFEDLIQSITSCRTFKLDNKITKDNYSHLIPVNTKYDKLLKASLKINENDLIDVSSTSVLEFTSSLFNVKYYVTNTNNSLKDDLLKEKEELLKIIDKRKTLLSNEKYVNNAPRNIVNMDKEKLASELNRLKMIEEKINSL